MQTVRGTYIDYGKGKECFTKEGYVDICREFFKLYNVQTFDGSVFDVHNCGLIDGFPNLSADFVSGIAEFIGVKSVEGE